MVVPYLYMYSRASRGHCNTALLKLAQEPVTASSAAFEAAHWRPVDPAGMASPTIHFEQLGPRFCLK